MADGEDYDGNLDLSQGWDYLVNGGDVEFCYTEVHNGEFRPFCLDPGWDGVMGAGPEEVGFLLYVGVLFLLGIHFLVMSWIHRKR